MNFSPIYVADPFYRRRRPVSAKPSRQGGMTAEFERVASLMDVVYTVDKNAFAEAFAKSSFPDGDVPISWFKPKLNKINNNDALSRIFAKPDLVERLVAEGHMSWVLDKISKMNDEQFARVFTQPIIALSLTGGGEKLFFERASGLINDKLTKILSIEGAAQLFVNHPKSKKAFERLTTLKEDQLTQMLKTREAVWDLAHAGHGPWVKSVIDGLPQQNQRSVFLAPAATEGLFATGHSDWLKKKLEPYNYTDTFSALWYRGKAYYHTEGYREFASEVIKGKELYMRRLKPDANPG